MRHPSSQDIERGKRIKKLRQEKEWSQEELANRIGRTISAISQFERGQGYSKDVLYKLAEVFKVTPEYIEAGSSNLTVVSEPKGNYNSVADEVKFLREENKRLREELDKNKDKLIRIQELLIESGLSKKSH